MTDVAARDNGVIIVLTGECAGICAVSNDAVWLGGLCLLMRRIRVIL